MACQPKRSVSARLFLCGGALGVLLFLLVYGLAPLDITNDAWLRGGFVEADTLQHYAGWLFYRTSPLSFPLGVAQNINYPAGLGVLYTDSIPLLAVLFRFVSPLLPATFQYFGWYTLLCFFLQGGFATLLVGLFLPPAVALLGALPLIASPVLLERAFRHTSLAAQFLLLAALYYYFRSGREKRDYYPAVFLLGCLTITLHPYFVPMFYAIVLAMALRGATRRHTLRPLAWLGGNLAATVAVGWAFGLFTGSGSGGSEVTYGYFSLNLNALWNPLSRWNTHWSRLLPVQNQTLGNYDAFMYLGLGVLAVLVLGGLWLAATRQGRSLLAGILRRHWALAVVFFLLSVFAVSNVVTANGATLFTLPLPLWLVRLCTIFRSSGRLFWPVYDTLLLAAVLLLWWLVARRRAAWGALALAALAAVQMWDISPALVQRHALFAAYTPVETAALTSDFWTQAAQRYTHIVVLDDGLPASLQLALYAADHGMTTNDAFAARYDAEALAAQHEALCAQLQAGQADPDCLYLIAEEPLFLQLAETTQNSCFCAQLDEKWFVLAPGMQYTGADATVYGDAYPLRIADYTDANWEQGVLSWDNQTIAFPDCAFTRRRLEGMRALRCGQVEYPILKLDDKDAGWLMVTLDIQDAHLLIGQSLEGVT